MKFIPSPVISRMKSGEELLKELPERLLDGITRGRKRALERTASPSEFLAKLRELAKSTRASWAFGFPRTGSSWFGRQFLGNFSDNIYKEPFELFQASGQDESRDKLNLGTQHEAPRPEIQKELDLTEAPLDRLLLAVHDSFWFYHHLDSILVADLK